MLFIIPNKIVDVPDHMLSDFRGPKLLPYGVLSCIAYVKKHVPTIEFKVIDFNVENETVDSNQEIIIQTLQQFQPDVVGVSVLFTNLEKELYRITELVKKINKKTIVIVGGVFASNEYSSILNATESIDGICFSEGELPLTRLLTAKDMHDHLNNDPSFITHKTLFDGKKPISSYIYNLDEIPFFDYSDFDLRDYETYNSPFRQYDDDDIALSIHTTRGCPFRCIFCCAADVHGQTMRYISADYLLSNVNQMISQYKLTILNIEDDNFFVDKKRAKKILRKLIELKNQGKLKYVNILNVAVNYLDEEIIMLLKKIDIASVSISSEHGTEYMLKKIIGKPCSLHQIKHVVSLLKKYKINHNVTMVVGIPGEREIDRREAVQFYLDLGVDWVVINIATPFKGSRLYQLCIDNHYISDEDLNYANISNSIINTPTMSAEQITEIAYLMNLEINFVNNYRMRIGDYDAAITRLANVATNHPQHAFAHYYLSKSYENMGDTAKYQKHRICFNKIIAFDQEWHKYALHFGLIQEISCDRA